MTDAVMLDCFCATSRQAARALSQFYDSTMQRAGIEVTHFTLCAEIRAHPGITSGELGRRLVMDKTTLTRTLHLMKSLDLIDWRPGQDRREKCWNLTAHGEAQFKAALPVWQGLQAAVRERLGDSVLTQWKQLAYDVAASLSDFKD